jgi:TonB family protein
MKNRESVTMSVVTAVALWLLSTCVHAGTTLPTLDQSSAMALGPTYPKEAIEKRHQGTVMLLVDIDASGKVAESRISTSSGFPELDQAALAVAPLWHFHPATRDGVAISHWITVPVNFNLSDLPPSQLASQPSMTPAEQAKIREELITTKNQPDTPESSGFLLQCKGPDGKLFTTRVLGPDCIVHEEISPMAVISDSPKGGWREVQSNAYGDFYFDDTSYGYVDAQAVPKRGQDGMAQTWLKVVWHKPVPVMHGTGTYNTMLMSLTYECRSNRMNGSIAWLYDSDGKVVNAYPPTPSILLRPEDPLASALQSYCKPN